MLPPERSHRTNVFRVKVDVLCEAPQDQCCDGQRTRQVKAKFFTVLESLEAQALSCANVGSALYGSLLAGLIDDYRRGGVTAELLDGVSATPVHDAIPLRYLATAHRLALGGQAPDLARWYGSCGGTWSGEDISADFLQLAHTHRSDFIAGLQRNVQTNEVGRAAVLASAFSLIARRHKCPLDLLEIGSSAGLLSRWDEYFYDAGSSSLGNPTSVVRFDRTWWRSPAPDLAGNIQVARRRGSDISPIDATSVEGQLTMLSFVWPDQSARVERLRCALDIATRTPIPLAQADAGDWLSKELAGGPTDGVATVVFHSIVWQYLPQPTRTMVRTALESAGELASPDSPLLWLRMEPHTPQRANVRLTTWPGGHEEVLAEVGYHGVDIEWLQPY